MRNEKRSMTNAEKYKTIQEQNDAFLNFCWHNKCPSCILYSICCAPHGDKNCRDAWLELETEEEYHLKEVEKNESEMNMTLNELNEEISITTGMVKGLELILKILRNNGREFEKACEHIEWVIQFEKEILNIKMIKRQEMNQRRMAVKRDEMLKERK